MKQYYLCAYGPDSIRVSEKVETEREAAIYTYGVTRGVTVLPIGTRMPKYLSQKRRVDLYTQLRELHAKRSE